MRICLLGTGSPYPDPERLGAAVLVSHDGTHVLFDAGRGVTTQLVRAGVAPHQLSAVFLTHHHFDHIGNLGDLLLSAWHGGSSGLALYGPHGTDDIVSALFERVYRREIAFSLAFAGATGDALVDVRDMVGVRTIEPGESVQWGDWSVIAAAVEHGHRLGLTLDEWPCLGYRVEVGGAGVVISGDTIACDGLVALARGADVLVMCCHLTEAELTTPARRLLSERVIASSGQVGEIAARAGVATLVLTHFGPLASERLADIEADVRSSYSGRLHLGHDLLSIDF